MTVSGRLASKIGGVGGRWDVDSQNRWETGGWPPKQMEGGDPATTPHLCDNRRHLTSANNNLFLEKINDVRLITVLTYQICITSGSRIF